MAGLTTAAADPESTPVLVVAAGDAGAVADRLCAVWPGGPPERLRPTATDGGLPAILRTLDAARRACLYIGPCEPLVAALAPLILDRDPPDRAPVVAVTPDGRAVVPLMGSERGSEDLARRVTSLLAVRGAGRTVAGPSEPIDRLAADAPPGRLAVVGLGPGDAGWMAPAVREELDRAEDIVGYTTYVRMAGPFRAGQRILDSDNRREMERARLAFSLAAQGRRVVVVSSGDPGVFAMATAVIEALEQAPDPAWRKVDLAILPGISAAQATAARVGAPLGHDFCALSLSDNLKPWARIEERLTHAAVADLVIALYNPRSEARPAQLESALALLRQHRAPDTPVVLGRDVGRAGERVTITTLGAVRPEQVDMRTLVIIGSSRTRAFPRGDGGSWVYTPRWYPPDEPPETP